MSGKQLYRNLGLFALFAALLGFRLAAPGVTQVFTDPVSGIRAQDEAQYGNAALRMATRGGWLTPRFLGRFLLVKPPLLVWLSAVCMKLGGISLVAFRLPVLVAGAWATWLLFLWVEHARSFGAAVGAVLLLVADPLWHILSRIAYTDMLLAAAVVTALYAVWRDPVLARGPTVALFAAAVSIGIMAKNAAGLLPVVAVTLFWVFTRTRPAAGAWRAAAMVLLLTAPWHAYQWIAHRQWFWNDYVRIQLLGFGLNPAAQPVREAGALFYLKRLLLTDPVLCLAAAIAFPSLLRASREHKSGAALLLAWIAVAGAALLAFQYRNLPYALELIAPLVLAATLYSPWRRQDVVAAILAAIFCFRVAAGAAQPWGISYAVPAPLPAVPWMRWYAALGRANELIAVDTDDEFYSAVLALPKVRYGFIDPAGISLRYAPHYGYLGITLDTARFDDLPRWAPQFRERLRQWGLDSSEPLATTIVASSTAGVLDMVATHPGSDFYLPAGMRAGIIGMGPPHRIVALPNGRFFLLAEESAVRETKRQGLE